LDLSGKVAVVVVAVLEWVRQSRWACQTNDWSAEPGEFTILVGGSSDNLQRRGKFPLIRQI
jgi:hypothetical protein